MRARRPRGGRRRRRRARAGRGRATSTFRTSPGSAPRTATGPVTTHGPSWRVRERGDRPRVGEDLLARDAVAAEVRDGVAALVGEDALVRDGVDRDHRAGARRSRPGTLSGARERAPVHRLGRRAQVAAFDLARRRPAAPATRARARPRPRRRRETVSHPGATAPAADERARPLELAPPDAAFDQRERPPRPPVAASRRSRCAGSQRRKPVYPRPAGGNRLDARSNRDSGPDPIARCLTNLRRLAAEPGMDVHKDDDGTEPGALEALLLAPVGVDAADPRDSERLQDRLRRREAALRAVLEGLPGRDGRRRPRRARSSSPTRTPRRCSATNTTSCSASRSRCCGRSGCASATRATWSCTSRRTTRCASRSAPTACAATAASSSAR